VVPRLVQFTQALPCEPHWSLRKPALQTLFWQQPAQFAQGGGGGAWQVWPRHSRPVAAQSWHVAPPLPHAPACVPTAHRPATQQPLAQETGPHGGGGGVVQMPPPTGAGAQKSPVAHARHA